MLIGFLRVLPYVAGVISERDHALSDLAAERGRRERVMAELVATRRDLADARARQCNDDADDARLLTAYRNHSEAARATIDHHSVCDKCSARPAPQPCADVLELAIAERRARFGIQAVLDDAS